MQQQSFCNFKHQSLPSETQFFFGVGGGFGSWGGFGGEGFDGWRRPRGRKLGFLVLFFIACGLVLVLVQQLGNELMGLLQDGTKNPYEQRQWMRSRIIQLEEQQVNHQYEAFELEKQRLKWLKFKEDKERDMEKLKLNNKRLKLESDRMILLLRMKELELLDLHQRQCSTSKRS